MDALTMFDEPTFFFYYTFYVYTHVANTYTIYKLFIHMHALHMYKCTYKYLPTYIYSYYIAGARRGCGGRRA